MTSSFRMFLGVSCYSGLHFKGTFFYLKFVPFFKMMCAMVNEQKTIYFYKIIAFGYGMIVILISANPLAELN